MSSNTRRRLLGFAALLGLPAIARAQAAQSQTSATPAPAILICERAQRDAAHEMIYRGKFTEDKGRLKPYSLNDSIITDRPVRTKFEPGYAASVENEADPKIFNRSSGIYLTVEWPLSTTSKVSFFARLKASAYISQVTATYNVAGEAAKPIENEILVKQAPLISHQDISFYWINPPAHIASQVVTVNLYASGKPIGSFEFSLMRRKWKEFIERHNADLAAKRDVTVAADGTVNVQGCYVEEAMPCFFTTAAVHILGLNDSCWELRSLRAFRDGPLSRMPGGKDLVRRYYDEAPGIVSAISRRDDADRVWIKTYWRYILPCALMARLRLDAFALDHYFRLVRHLSGLKGSRARRMQGFAR